MQHIGPSVFITSKESLSTLRELSANRSLASEACCLDHQPSRLRQFTTFSSYVYDLDLRRMSPLFAAVMTTEKELAVYHTLDVVERCLAEQFETDAKFEPNLVIADEASCIRNGVARKLGKEKVQKIFGTCQLHYLGSVLQHCSQVIGTKTEIWQFMKMAQQLMQAESPQIYELFKTEMLSFISKTEKRHDYLYNWFEFYDSRKTGWSKAYRNAELPKTNKGEAGNSRYSAITHLTGLPLDLGVKCMIAEFHVYAGCKKGIVTGLYKGGSGPSRVNMENRLISEIFERIRNTPLTAKDSEEFVKNVLEKLGLKEDIEENEDSENDENQVAITKQRSQLQTHRFLEEQQKARTEARVKAPTFINTPHKAPKKMLKRRIQFSNTLEDLTGDEPHAKKKHKPRNLNEKVLETLKEGVTLKTLEPGVYQLTIKEDPARCYEINLNAHPTCTCPQFEKNVKSRPVDRNTLVCKHIPTMMLILGFTYNDKIIRKYAYNATDRISLNLKSSTFAHSEVDISIIRRNFENEVTPRMEEAAEKVELPYFDSKKHYGWFNSYHEGKIIIDKQTERYPCQWFAIQYSETRYVCGSACHVTEDKVKDRESQKLRPNLKQDRPLVFLVYYTRMFQNPKTKKYSAKNEKKYYHMQQECISNLGEDLLKFSNIKMPYNVDASRLSDQNRKLVKTTFSNVTFVEDT